jgi:hypothetical protein
LLAHSSPFVAEQSEAERTKTPTVACQARVRLRPRRTNKYIPGGSRATNRASTVGHPHPMKSRMPRSKSFSRSTTKSAQPHDLLLPSCRNQRSTQNPKEPHQIAWPCLGANQRTRSLRSGGVPNWPHGNPQNQRQPNPRRVAMKNLAHAESLIWLNRPTHSESLSQPSRGSPTSRKDGWSKQSTTNRGRLVARWLTIVQARQRQSRFASNSVL